MGPIYSFYSNMTSAPIVNYFSKELPGVKLVDYQVIDFPHNSIYGDQAKVFTLGYEGYPFSLLISKDDIISISLAQPSIPGTHINSSNTKMNLFLKDYLGGSSEIKQELKQVKHHLAMMVRDSKINQILN